MADHSKPTNTSLYTDYTTELDARFDDLAQGLDPAVTTVTNMPTNSIRWNSANSYWEKYNGTNWVTLDTGYEIDLAGARKILTNSASPALTITQAGSGNALVVEDSANPDATPFVIDGTGRTYIGVNAGVVPSVGYTNNLVVAGQDNNIAGMSIFDYASTSTPRLTFLYSPSGTVGTQAAVSNGTALGEFRFLGSDGTSFIRSAAISAQVDGTPGTNDMPGRLVFSTTADGGSTPIEAFRLDSAQQASIGGVTTAGVGLRLAKALTGATTAFGYRVDTNVANDVTVHARGFGTNIGLSPSTVVTDFSHFIAAQGTFGLGASATNQYGFNASSITGATNNYGFYSNLAGASGRWNFYANGTAPNYFAGDVRTNTTVLQAASPSNSNTSVTITIASMIAGLRTGKPVANIDYTLPTGTLTDAAFQDLQTNQSFEWSVINLAAATFTITLLAATGHTVVGNMVVQPNTSARFLTRKSAANTFITYRIA